MNHAPVGEKECECWECLCVGQALVRVTSRSFPTAAAAPEPETFLRARLFRFLNKEHFSTSSPQSGGVFLKIGCFLLYRRNQPEFFLKMGYESEKFRARG